MEKKRHCIECGKLCWGKSCMSCMQKGKHKQVTRLVRRREKAYVNALKQYQRREAKRWEKLMGEHQ
jgi:recombinational DNA repair protein RecR